MPQQNTILNNAKELNQETGWYYYGARYYDPQVSTWLSVDPLVEKYPAFSPYNFTMNNPVRLVDADGRGTKEHDWVPVKGQPGKWKAQKGDSAGSLAKDANIKYEHANALVQNQLGKNKVIDGKEYSNVKVGDVISIPEENVAVSTQETTIVYPKDRDKNLGKIDSINNKID